MRTDFTLLKGISLDRESPLPLYQQLAAQIEDMISNGRLSPGERLPSNMDLSRILDINCETANKALVLLSDKGMVVRRRKTGTFVSDDIERRLPSIGFFYFREAEKMMLEAAEWIQRECASRGYDMKLVGFDGDFYDRNDLCREISVRGLEGAIVVLLNCDSCRRALEDLEHTGFPLVRFGNSFFMETLRSPLIRGNDRQCCQQALKYLQKRGHTRIGLVNSGSGWEMEQEYLKSYASTGGYRDGWIKTIEFTGSEQAWFQTPGAGELPVRYLRDNTDLTAVLVENPGICLDFLRRCTAAGRPVPEDLSLICLRDIAGLGMVWPAPTAMHLSRRRLSEEAVAALFRRMSMSEEERISVPGETIFIDYTVKERESVKTVA
ncbi:MAG: GntR family transcriptional regulator [bacterium]|nr:GntR family transcriptional regulator [bacterium]